MRKKALLIVALLGFELFREWFVLRNLGFEPGRFVQWVRGDEISFDIGYLFFSVLGLHNTYYQSYV